MTITSLGDLASAFILRRHNAEAKTQIQTLSSELTTGVAQDRGAHLSGNLAPLAGIAVVGSSSSIARRNATSCLAFVASMANTWASADEW